MGVLDNIFFSIMVCVVFYFGEGGDWVSRTEGQPCWIDQQVAPWYSPSSQMRLVLLRHSWSILLASKSEHIVCTIARMLSLCRLNDHNHDLSSKWSPSQLVFPDNTWTVNCNSYLLKRVTHPLVFLFKIEKYTCLWLILAVNLLDFCKQIYCARKGKYSGHLYLQRTSDWWKGTKASWTSAKLQKVPNNTEDYTTFGVFQKFQLNDVCIEE